MKVLYVLSKFPQNSESYVTYEMAYIARRGIQIEVWASATGYGDPSTLPIHRGPLDAVIARVRPDVIHIHHMTTAAYHLHLLPKDRRTTIRAHSFDWNEGDARRLIASREVGRLFGFPYLVRNIPEAVPLPVAVDETAVFRADGKNRRHVVRLAAGLRTKRLTDFLEVGNRLHAEAHFTLAVNTAISLESFIGELHSENKKRGGHVTILTDLSRTAAIDLIRSAGIYMATYDEKAHPFGMPISMAEALMTGSLVIARETAGLPEYLGQAKIGYHSVDAAEAQIRLALKFNDSEWRELSEISLREGERFRSDIVLPRLVEEWNKIYLDNF